MSEKEKKTLEDYLIRRKITHAVYLESFARGLSEQMLVEFNKANLEIRSEIAGLDLSKKMDLNKAQKIIRDKTNSAYSGVKKKYEDEMLDLPSEEIDILIEEIKKAGNIELKKPSASTIIDVYNNTPIDIFPTIAKWFDLTSEYSTQKTISKIKKLWDDGADLGQIAAELGAKTESEIRSAETFIRTSTKALSEAAQAKLYANNKSIIDKYQWVSVLDSRTSIICAQRDGKVFVVGKGPMPPAHPNCRSTTSPIFKDGTKQGDGARYSASGKVGADVRYRDWLKDQPEYIQKEVLGKTRYEIFKKSGGKAFDRFVTPSGTIKTLKELKEKRRRE